MELNPESGTSILFKALKESDQLPNPKLNGILNTASQWSDCAIAVVAGELRVTME